MTRFILIVFLCFSISLTYSLSEIEEVVSGEANIQYPDSPTLQIDAGASAIINYKSFNINECVLVNFPSSDCR